MTTADRLFTIALADEQATGLLAQDLSVVLMPGDVVALSGTLGAGKTTFCRALLRALAGDDGLEVPSPTFTLLQPYDLGRIEVAHIDLYRIADPEELIELGFEELIAESVVLVEWPDRADGFMPEDTLWLTIETGENETERRISFDGDPARWQERLARSAAIRSFLDKHGWEAADRRFLQGDASYRQYEIVSEGDRTAILMNAPERPLDPIVRDGRAYSEIAHITRTIHPFVAVDRALAEAGIRVPELLGVDLDDGILLLEHLGTQTIAENDAPVAERYLAATEVLARLHSSNRMNELPLPDGTLYTVPDYDRGALMIEVGIFLDWHVEQGRGEAVCETARQRFQNCWTALFDILKGAEKSLVLRDFHSPNLLWRPQDEGTDRVGVIDFQDAQIGPVAYDLASLMQDARVTIPPSLQNSLVSHYCAARERLGGQVEEAVLREGLAIMAAQRATKIIGLFTRLSKRDGKDQYLAHLPRVFDYLGQCLSHPVLSDLRACYEGEGWVEAHEN